VFVSDHGENLGENGKYGHGFAVHPFEKSKEQTNVATFIWASDKFIAKNPKKFSAIKNNKNNNIDHSFIFHTILDCSGIESEIIDKNKSLCYSK
jgi:glucan phosphoethanolaminetransferase (alkaline phosphatase superfamily)